ncbi:MAG TPA: 2-oxoacid:ferredoxin oxidoreductase subunit beta [Candidatus Krumholzibacteria bacterium]|jgi:2-oxoglutarate ferredoxin oxidoreductase subunit beta
MSVMPLKAPPEEGSYPWEDLLRTDRLPHIWCPECGIGVAVSCFTAALSRSELDMDKVAIVSGIGCTGRVAGYMRLDSFHTTHGRAIPFATGLKMANPKLKVVVFSGDGDLISIGGNHFIHAARRNVDMTVICVNNFNYAMTGGQVGPTTPLGAHCSTTPYGNFEHPFSLPALAASSGAVFVSRWTTLQARRLIKSIDKALRKPGFSFVEVISACPTLYTRKNNLGSGLDLMRAFRDRSEIRHDAPLDELAIDFGGKIVVGDFVDIDKPTYMDAIDSSMETALGENYARIDALQTVLAERRALRDT